MRIVWCFGLWTLTAMTGWGDTADPYAPLRLYQGSWEMTSKGPTDGAKATRIDNDCARIGRFYGCQQTVDGKAVALVLFLPAEKPGHYITQSLRMDGSANGKGELDIEGNRWVYLGQGQVKGKDTIYRTTNVFTGKDRIHFEVGQSVDDGKTWTPGMSGDEVRVGH